VRGDLGHPQRFVRGRLARRLAGGYLVAVMVTWAAATARAASGDIGDPGSGALDPVWVTLLCLTAPFSLTIGPVAGVLIFFFPVGGLLQFPLYGAVLAWVLWRLLRGRRLATTEAAGQPDGVAAGPQRS
jgi:hypothetical protein